MASQNTPEIPQIATQKEFDERADNVSTLVYRIKRRGKQIYARA